MPRPAPQFRYIQDGIRLFLIDQIEIEVEAENEDEADLKSWEEIVLSDLETDYMEIEEIEEGLVIEGCLEEFKNEKTIKYGRRI